MQRPLTSGLLAGVVLTVLATASCRKVDPTREPPPASASAPRARVNTGAVTESQARTLLDAWLAAQRDGDFAAYEALYAPRFEGVRRSGSHTARLDRAHWMKERKRMLEQKPSVAATEVAVTVSSDTATVRFTQTWRSGAYRDEGPKRMVLARVGGQLKIAREEMLRSSVLPSVTEESFAFVVDLGGPTSSWGGERGAPHLVIRSAAKDEWSAGEPELVSLDTPVVARRAVNVRNLPPAVIAPWTGKKVELFGKSGVVCEGTIGTPSVVGRLVPHFETSARWRGTDAPKPAPAAVAGEAWDLSGGSSENGRLLVAEVKPDRGTCAGALWGRPVAASKPALVEAAAADDATKKMALTELRKSKAYADLQSQYAAEREPGDPASWEDFDARTSVQVFAHPLGTVVTLSIAAGPGCGRFGGTLSAAWEKKGASLVPIRDPEEVELAPISAGDVNGDGRLDLVMKEALLPSRGDKLDPLTKLLVPMLDCGC